MLKSTVGINDYEELVPQHEPYSCLIYRHKIYNFATILHWLTSKRYKKQFM